MTVHIVRGDARKLPLADASVDLVVTSPPFLNLRAYTDGGQTYDGQIGAGSRDKFLQDLWDVTAECARVLKPCGSIWVELGDSYTNKSLNLSPHRYAIGCTDRLGLILRAEVCWSRPNGLPESVTDRVRRSHSVWFHLVKEPRYYSAIDHIRQPHVATLTGRDTSTWRTGPSGQNRGTAAGRRHSDGGRVADFAPSPLGALPGSVWEVPTEPLQVPAHLGIDHFAAYPTALIKPIILGWSPSGICTACGEGRRPILTKGAPIPTAEIAGSRKRRSGVATGPMDRGDGSQWISGNVGAVNGQEWNAWKAANPDRITGEVCGCPDTTAPTRPALILDPFGGTGTTALVGNALGRDAVSVDMSADYCRLATWRTQDPGQIAKVLGVAKPPVQLAGQTDLLAELDGGAA